MQLEHEGLGRQVEAAHDLEEGAQVAPPIRGFVERRGSRTGVGLAPALEDLGPARRHMDRRIARQAVERGAELRHEFGMMAVADRDDGSGGRDGAPAPEGADETP